MADYSATIKGFKEANDAMRQDIEALQPSGAMGQAVKDALLMAQVYADKVSHIDTGTLHNSHIIQYDGNSGFVYPSPYNINPKSHKPPSEYGIYEAGRGGMHDFYGRTVDEEGQHILEQTGLQIVRAFN